MRSTHSGIALVDAAGGDLSSSVYIRRLVSPDALTRNITPKDCP